MKNESLWLIRASIEPTIKLSLKARDLTSCLLARLRKSCIKELESINRVK